MKNKIDEVIESLQEISQEQIDLVASRLFYIREQGNRVWIVGNGGSSLLASHLTSDLANLGFDAYCLTDNIARLTAITNDFGWKNVYSRQLKELFKPGDCLVIFTVHGSSGKSDAGEEWSANLYDAAKFVRENDELSNTIIVFSGCDGGDLYHLSSLCLSIASKEAYVVEGVNSALAHLVCHALTEMKK